MLWVNLLSRILSTLLLVAALALFLLICTAPPSPSGVGYAASFLLLAAAGVLSHPLGRRRVRVGACALAAATIAMRLVVASGGGATVVHMSTPRMEGGARWLDRVIDEEDLSVNASRALAWTHFVRDPDVPELAPVMSASYSRMRRAVGPTPSPVLATYAGLERPGADDRIEVGDVAASKGVVLFLHGFAGSFTLPCWVVSRAATTAGFATVCPSTRWVGDWWSPEGEETLRETIAELRRRGARRFVLAGLSNGGIGASLLAPRLRGSFEGLVLISGASPEAQAPSVPTLVIQGERDAQISADLVRAYALRVGARYHPLDAGHFAMLLRQDDVVATVAAFLRALPVRALAPASLAELPGTEGGPP